MKPQSFLVGYGSMSDSVKKPNGHKTFIVVDDYAASESESFRAIWDEMLFVHNLKSPGDGVTLLNVMHSQAYDGPIWAKGGIVCPAYEMLPVVFCIEHGKQTGEYITNATAKEAADFVRGLR